MAVRAFSTVCSAAAKSAVSTTPGHLLQFLWDCHRRDAVAVPSSFSPAVRPRLLAAPSSETRARPCCCARGTPHPPAPLSVPFLMSFCRLRATRPRSAACRRTLGGMPRESWLTSPPSCNRRARNGERCTRTAHNCRGERMEGCRCAQWTCTPLSHTPANGCAARGA